MKFSVVYVHLGNNPTPTLNHYGALARDQNLWQKLVLVTDKPELHRHFPGELVTYSRSKSDLRFRRFASIHKVRDRVAGGFWNYSLERVFALMEVARVCGNSPLIHVESDVSLTLTANHLQIVNENVVRTSIPRHGPDLGAASILIAPSTEQLMQDLDQVLDLLSQKAQSSNGFFSDMQLLGAALEANLLAELPTSPDQAWLISKSTPQHRLIFDAAPFGQYLFGVDPIHNQGYRVSGYQNPRAPIILNRYRWDIRQSDCGRSTVSVSNAAIVLELANLHIHSKELIPIPDSSNDRWRRALAEANHEVARLRSGPFPDYMNHHKVSLLDRIRIFRELSIFERFRNSIMTGRLSVCRRVLARILIREHR